MNYVNKSQKITKKVLELSAQNFLKQSKSCTRTKEICEDCTLNYEITSAPKLYNLEKQYKPFNILILNILLRN